MVEVFKEIDKLFFALGAHGALLDTVQHFAQVIKNEFAFAFGIASAGKFAEELGGFEEIAQLMDGFVFYRGQYFLFVFLLLYFEVGELIGFEQVVGIGVHAFAQVLIEYESEDVVAKFIGTHFPTEGVGNLPELLFEVFGHL